MPVPTEPKIYHIVHVDRLLSIIEDGYIWCDAEVIRRTPTGSTIGMNGIKQRRLNELQLDSFPELYVGDCVPFYFCPRSVMLYLIYQANHPELSYRGGQEPIIHLVADLQRTVTWAEEQGNRWVFTLSNAGARYFEDRCDLADLDEISWSAIEARNWQGCKEGKQAEFLLESAFPWELITHIGVNSLTVYNQVRAAIQNKTHQPLIQIQNDWYY